MIAGGSLRISLLAAAGCTVAVACRGDVYLRGNGTAGPAGAAGPDRVGYAASVGVNGGKGKLQVLGFDGDFDTAVAALRTTLFAGRENHLKAGEGMAFGIVRTENSVVRVLVTKAGETCTMFRLEQSPAEFADSLRRAASPETASLPVYPGSVPLFSGENTGTDSVVEVSRVNADPSTAWSFMDSGMRKAGWTPMAGQERQSSPDGGGMSLYVRGKEVCCVLVRQRAGGAESLVGVMLHQRKNRNGENE